MAFTQERYTDSSEIFSEVHSFLRNLYRLTGKLQTWEFVRLEFWKWREAAKSSDPGFLANNACLWRNEADELAGLFISESGDDFFSLLIHPDYPHLADEMISWTRDVWGKGKENLHTDCYEYSQEAAALEASGFVRQGHIGNTRRYDLANTTYKVILPEGFTVKCITEAPDYEGKSETIQRAFRPDDLVSEKVDYWRKDLPSYGANLDFSVVNPAGQHIAFCFGFVDPGNGIAVIETIGTHPDYQQRGFGKAVVSACFNRLKEQGICTAYITGFSPAANALYQSLSPVKIFPMYAYGYKG